RNAFPNVTLAAYRSRGGCSPFGNHPVEHPVRAYALSALRMPISHIVVVGNHPGAWSQLAQQPATQPQVDLRHQIERNHRGLAEVGVEQVLLDDLHAIGHAGLTCVLVGFSDPLGIDVDAHATRATFRCGDDDAAVAAAEIVDDIVLT